MKKRARPYETNYIKTKKQRTSYNQCRSHACACDDKNAHDEVKQELLNVKKELAASLERLKHAKTEMHWMKRTMHAKLEGNYKIELSRQLAEMRRYYEAALCTQERHYHKVIACMNEKDVPMSIYG